MLKGSVLIVERNRDMANLLVELLTQYGYATVVAQDGPAAVLQLTVDRPRAIVLDLSSSEPLDPKTFARCIASTGAHVRLVGLTSYPDIGATRRQLLAAGFDEILRKPIDLARLVAVLAAP